MGTRRRQVRREEFWYRGDLAEAPGHPFYRKLNEVLEKASFDEFCEARCRKFYHDKLGRPSLAPMKKQYLHLSVSAMGGGIWQPHS